MYVYVCVCACAYRNGERSKREYESKLRTLERKVSANESTLKVEKVVPVAGAEKINIMLGCLCVCVCVCMCVFV